MQQSHYLQRNLFDQDRKTLDIPAAQKSTLIRLIECLLVEALGNAASNEACAPTTDTMEAAHEQDHA